MALAQKVIEEIVIKMVKEAKKLTNSKTYAFLGSTNCQWEN